MASSMFAFEEIGDLAKFGDEIANMAERIEQSEKLFDNTIPSYDDRTAFVSADAQGLTRNVAVTDGVIYRREAGLSLPSLNNWRPLDDTLDLRHVGSVSELSSDFSGRFSQAVNDCTARGWDLRVSQKTDGTPYEYRFIDHNLTGDLRASFDINAVLIPAKNFQHFPTNGSMGPFEITEFQFDLSEGALQGSLVTSAGAETKLVQGTDFSVIDKYVTLTTTPPSGSTLVIVTRKDALQFRSTTNNKRRLILTGDVHINLSNIGYAVASASGSGLTLTNVDHSSVERLWVYSQAGYGTGPLERRGDSAFTPLNFKSCFIQSVYAEGMNDLAVYASGGGSSGTGDDSGGLYIGKITARNCHTGAKYVRQGENAYIGSINLQDCNTGFLVGATNGISNGGGIHIGSINAVRLGRRALDVRDYPQGGLHVGAISVRDIGYAPDGVTLENAPSGVYFQNVCGAQVDYLDVRQRDRPTPPNVPAIQMGGDNNYGNRVLGGWVEGLDSGIRETGSATNDVGNSFTMTLKDVPTPIMSSGALQTHYDLTLLTETAGVVTQKRINNLYGDRKAGTPTFLLPGAVNSPTYAYTTQDLTYRKVLDFIEFSLRIQGQITHTETSRPLRIYLPEELTNVSLAQVPVTLGRTSGVSLPTNEVFAEVNAESNYIVLQCRHTDGAQPTSITTDHFTSGVTIRFEVSGLIPV